MISCSRTGARSTNTGSGIYNQHTDPAGREVKLPFRPWTSRGLRC